MGSALAHRPEIMAPLKFKICMLDTITITITGNIGTELMNKASSKI